MLSPRALDLSAALRAEISPQTPTRGPRGGRRAISTGQTRAQRQGAEGSGQRLCLGAGPACAYLALPARARWYFGGGLDAPLVPQPRRDLACWRSPPRAPDPVRGAHVRGSLSPPEANASAHDAQGAVRRRRRRDANEAPRRPKARRFERPPRAAQRGSPRRQGAEVEQRLCLKEAGPRLRVPRVAARAPVYFGRRGHDAPLAPQPGTSTCWRSPPRAPDLSAALVGGDALHPTPAQRPRPKARRFERPPRARRQREVRGDRGRDANASPRGAQGAEVGAAPVSREAGPRLRLRVARAGAGGASAGAATTPLAPRRGASCCSPPRAPDPVRGAHVGGDALSPDANASARDAQGAGERPPQARRQREVPAAPKARRVGAAPVSREAGPRLLYLALPRGRRWHFGRRGHDAPLAPQRGPRVLALSAHLRPKTGSLHAPPGRHLRSPALRRVLRRGLRHAQRQIARMPAPNRRADAVVGAIAGAERRRQIAGADGGSLAPSAGAERRRRIAGAECRHPWPAAMAGAEKEESPLLRAGSKPRQRPTLPQGCPCSTIGPGELNFRVRDGNGCDLSGITARKN